MTFWRYDGPDERVYTSVPVTVRPGDVVELDGVPAEDGHWTEVKGGDYALTRPDNEPRETEPVEPATEPAVEHSEDQAEQPDDMISHTETEE